VHYLSDETFSFAAMESFATAAWFKNLFKVLKIFCFVLCAAIFVVLMNDVWEKYNSQMTNTATQFIENKKDLDKLLPAMSVCPLPAFKKSGLFYSRNLFDENSFGLVGALVFFIKVVPFGLYVA